LSGKVFLSLLALGALSFAGLVCAPNALRLRRLGGKVERLRCEVDALEGKRAGLLESISALRRGDDFAWEREVRKKLGWVRPGEIELRGDKRGRRW